MSDPTSRDDSVTLSSGSDDAPVVPRPKSAAMTAALHAADAAAALTDTPVAPVASGSGSGSSDATGSNVIISGGGKDPLLDAQSVSLPHLPSPFDSLYPQTKGGDRWVKLAPDGHCMLSALEPGSGGPNAPVLHRVYVNVVGMLGDGSKFMDFPHEELDFTLGQAQVPKGLEMAVCQMSAGQFSLVRCCPDYGYSATRRPPTVPADSTLFFSVRVLRWEKEKNLHEMTLDDKYTYCQARREIGKDLFAASKPRSAIKQYDKALTVMDSIRNHEVDAKTVQTKHELMTLFLVNQAQCHMKLKEYSKVLETTGKALALTPQHMKALLRRADAHRAREEWSEALVAYEKVLGLFKPGLSATPAEVEELAARARAEEAVLVAVRTAVKDVTRRNEQATVAQRKKMSGFMRSAAAGGSSDSAAGGGGGLGLYDDMPMVSPTANKPAAGPAAAAAPEDDFSWLNQNAQPTESIWTTITNTASAFVAFIRSWCPTKQQPEADAKKKQ